MTSPTKSPKKTGARTKQRLMDAMIKVVGSEGIQNASVRAIAREADCNEAVLYHHFENKHAMQEEVFSSLVLELAETRRASATNETDLGKFIRSWVESSYRFYDERPNAFSFVLLTFPPVMPIDHPVFTANSDLFVACFREITPPPGSLLNLTDASFSAFRGLLLGPPRDIHLGKLAGPATNFVDEIAALGTTLLLKPA